MSGEALRAFRWASVDPYVRRHGVSRWNLWGGLLGSVLWIPAFGVVLALQGRFDAPFLAALTLPYGGLVLLARKRARTPAALWMGWVWACMGAYGIYVFGLIAAVPAWGALLSSAGGPPRFFGTFGAIALAVGLFQTALYRRKVARAPRFRGAPPADDP